jgi:hypothetical protein
MEPLLFQKFRNPCGDACTVQLQAVQNLMLFTLFNEVIRQTDIQHETTIAVLHQPFIHG